MVTRAGLVGQSAQRQQILVKGEAVYQCDVCKRRIRIPSSKYSIDVIQRCIITKNCLGKLHKVLTTAEANDTSAIPPAVPGVADWVQRRVFSSHVQAVENQIWTVEHNLANRPTVQVFVIQIQDGEEVLVEVDPVAVRTIDLNTVEIEFARPEKGQAQCLAYASQNTVNPEVGTPTVLVQETMLLTNIGELTIATTDDASLVDFVIRYRSISAPGGVIDVQYVGVDDQPAIRSPWVGVDRVYVNGRVYTVRSFNLINHPLAPSAFSNGFVANGTQFYFPSLNVLNQNLILLGTPPFTVVDRVVDRYIDIAAINSDQPELAYTSGNAFATPAIVRSVYPLISVVD